MRLLQHFPVLAGDIEVGRYWVMQATRLVFSKTSAKSCLHQVISFLPATTSKLLSRGAACSFLQAWWAIHGVHDGKKIMCHYGVSSRKRRPSRIAHQGLTPREEMTKTRKEETKCPSFWIHYYYWVDYAGSNHKKPEIVFY
jgi:hypothetical protein